MSDDLDDLPDCTPTEHQPYCRKYKPPETTKMSNENTWIPPGMRACTWDDAQWAMVDGSFRLGIVKDSVLACAYSNSNRENDNITWLCIDTPKPQHAPEPWREHGFERCTVEEAPRDRNGFFVWDSSENAPTMVDTWKAGYNPIRPSAEKGLREAVEFLVAKSSDASKLAIGAAALLREYTDERYPPPVCGECGRVK